MRGGAGDGRRRGRRSNGMQESHRRLRSETVRLPEHKGKGGRYLVFVSPSLALIFNIHYQFLVIGHEF